MHPALARLVGPVPHQPDRLAHRLGDLRAASIAWSPNSLWPKEPPPVITLTVTLSCGRPIALAMSSWATIGTLSPAQTVGVVGAHVGDGGVGLERRAAAEHEREVGLDGLGQHRDLGYGERHLGLAQLGEDRRVGLALDRSGVPVDVERPDRVDALAEGPGAHRDPGVDHAPRRSPRASPGPRPCCGCCFGVPLSVGGRHTMVGSASGTSRSIANFFLPVTMSRASTRLVRLADDGEGRGCALSSTSTCFVVGCWRPSRRARRTSPRSRPGR